jgi:formylglycine-generating enzyme required for sulfatase activity
MKNQAGKESSVLRRAPEGAHPRARCAGIVLAIGLAAGFAASVTGCGRDQETQASPAVSEDVALRCLKTLKGFDGKVWTNSLGMKAALVPPTGLAFCIWETRVRDYEAFATATNADASWKDPGFPQTPDHPVVKVSMKDAKAFCAWLTAKERAAGVIGKDMLYRLPTDEEWSIAVGLPAETGRTPKDRDLKINDHFPWGTQWPPPKGAGNYAMEGLDEFRNTAPVGSFAANKFGLHDLGGNVWEWCQDEYEPGRGFWVLRGGSWGNDARVNMLSSNRLFNFPDFLNASCGFRCVLVLSGG